MAEVLKQASEEPVYGRTPELNRQEELDHFNGAAYSDQETSLIGLDADQKETPKTIIGRSLEILAESQQPMTIGEIWKVFSEKEDFQEINQASLRDSLTYLCRGGKIQRLENGVYACLEFDDANYEPPKNLDELIVEILNTAGQPMKNKEIIGRLNMGSPASFTPKRTRYHLRRLCNEAKIQQLAQGVYACSEFDVEKYLPPQTISRRILRILNDTKQPMKIESILQSLNEDDIAATGPAGIVNNQQIRKYLSIMCNRGDIKRLAPGIYSYLEFNGGENEIPKSIGDRIIESLNSTKLPMTGQDVTDYCNKNGFEMVDQRIVITRLSHLYRCGKIKRLAKGVYAYLEFDDQFHETPKTVCERIMEALQNSGQPMPIREITDNLNQGNHEEITSKKTTDILKYLCQQERIRHLARGVYSCLEFEGQYEPPAPAQPKEKKRTNIGNTKPAPRAPAQKRIKTSNKPRNDFGLKSAESLYDVSLKRPSRQQIMPTSSRIMRIIKNRSGPMTANEVIEALNQDGFRKVNPEIVRSFVENKLRRAGN